MVWANGPTPGDKRDFGGEPGAKGARLAPKSPRNQNQKSKLEGAIQRGGSDERLFPFRPPH